MPGAVIAQPRPLPLALPLAAAAAAALITWLASVGDISDYFRYELPPGQVPYIFSKLAGLATGMLLITQLLLVLLRDTRAFRRRFAWNTHLHASFGMLTVIALVTHVTLFVTAASLRGDAVALDLLLPVFDHGPYRTGVSLGGLGLLLVLVAAPMGLMAYRGQQPGAARRFHPLVSLALVLGMVHAWIIGSEKTTVLALAAGSLAVLAALGWRLWSAARARRRQA